MPQSSRLFKFTAVILTLALLVTVIPAGAFGCGDSPPAVSSTTTMQSEYTSLSVKEVSPPVLCGGDFLTPISLGDIAIPAQGEYSSLAPEIASPLEQNDWRTFGDVLFLTTF